MTSRRCGRNFSLPANRHTKGRKRLLSRLTFLNFSKLGIIATGIFWKCWDPDKSRKKTDEMYYRRARIQVLNNLNDFKVFWSIPTHFLSPSQTISCSLLLTLAISGYLVLSRAILSYLGLSWSISAYFWLSLAISGYMSILGYQSSDKMTKQAWAE